MVGAKCIFFAAEGACRSRRGRSSSSNLHGSSIPVALRVVGAVLMILNLIKYMAVEKNRGLVLCVQFSRRASRTDLGATFLKKLSQRLLID